MRFQLNLPSMFLESIYYRLAVIAWTRNWTVLTHWEQLNLVGRDSELGPLTPAPLPRKRGKGDVFFVVVPRTEVHGLFSVVPLGLSGRWKSLAPEPFPRMFLERFGISRAKVRERECAF